MESVRLRMVRACPLTSKQRSSNDPPDGNNSRKVPQLAEVAPPVVVTANSEFSPTAQPVVLSGAKRMRLRFDPPNERTVTQPGRVVSKA